MTGRHMITAIQAAAEAGVGFGRVIARSTVNRWMTNTPTATTAPTRSSDAPLIMAPHAHLRSAVMRRAYCLIAGVSVGAWASRGCPAPTCRRHWATWALALHRPETLSTG